MQAVRLGTAENYWEKDWLALLFSPLVLDSVLPGDAATDQAAFVLYSDSDGHLTDAVVNLLKKFQARNTPVCLVHLSDEFLGCPIDCYSMATAVVRNYFRPTASILSNVMHIPLGYKIGFNFNLKVREMQERKYQWFFAGEIKGSRRKMLSAAEQIPGGRSVITSRWDDPAGLSTEQYAAALNDAVFAPCPRGNDSVDCFRIWESLEAGAIPIVEDDGRFSPLLDGLKVPERLRSPFQPRGRFTGRYRALFGHSYWSSMFDESLPLLRLYDWSQLPQLIQNVGDPALLARRTRVWWEATKDSTRLRLRQLLAPLLTSIPPSR